MRWSLSVWALGGASALCAGCGGAEFKAGVADAGSDVTAPLYFPPDGALDADALLDGSPAADGPGPAPQSDAPTDAPSHCAGDFACTPGVPDGWTGPLELYSGSTAAPACGAGFGAIAFDGNDALTSGPASCHCQCGAPQGVECDVPTIMFYPPYSAGMCGGSTCVQVGPTEGSCQAFNLVGCVDGGAVGTVAMTVAPTSLLPPSGGSCAPMPTKELPPTTWGTYARACSSTLGTSQADCPTGGVCAPRAASPFRPSLCVSHPGDVACPTTGYTAGQRFFGSSNDTRDCSACTCGAPTGDSCVVHITTYSSQNGSCNGMSSTTYTPPFNCEPVAGHADYRVTTAADGGACAPSPVSPVGAATPSDAMTFCCLP